MYAEINDVIGFGRLTVSDRLRLPYTAAVISEVQRICNFIPVPLAHTPMEDTTLGGYTIPKGMPVVSNFTSLTMDPELYPEPTVFKPERFLDDDNMHVAKSELYPFGKGTAIS